MKDDKKRSSGTLFGSLRDRAASFVGGGFIGFLGGSVSGFAYLVASSLATSIGMTGGAAVAAGVLATLFTGGLAVGVGLLAGGALLITTAALSGAKDIKPGAATLGAMAGVGGAIAMVASMAGGDEPAKDVSLHLEQKESVSETAAVQKERAVVPVLGSAFDVADSGQTVTTIDSGYAKTAPTAPRLAL